MELPFAGLDRFLRGRAQVHVRWLQTLPLVGTVLLTAALARTATLSNGAAALIEGFGRSLPQLTVDPATLGWYTLGFAFLASPANHLVRCFVGKSPDGQLAYSIRRSRRTIGAATANLPVSEVAAAKDAAREGEAGENTALRAGRAIGTLERWIMVALILVGQYSLIGLVLTAKSIARFKKIEQDPEFAEYYLLGTLYSTLIALVCGMALIYV